MIIEKLINSKTQTVIFFFIVSIIYLLLPLFKLFELNSETIKIFNLIFSSVTLFFSSLYLTNIIFEKSIIKKNNIVVPIVFLALCMPVVDFKFLLIGNLILIISLNEVFNLYQKNNPFTNLFNCSFAISACTLIFNYYFGLFYILVPLSLYIFGNNSWRSYFVSIIGLLCPIIIFYFLKFNGIYLNFEKQYVTNILNIHELKYWIILFFIICFFSTVELFVWINKKSSKSRRCFYIIFLYLFVSISIFIFSGDSDFLLFSIAPISIILSNFFIYSRFRFISNLLLITFILNSLYNRFLII
ncbi:MAG: hypothetical protein CMP71_04745 [Flavobacteriales bacterium]|nr:hypothetical protein [Flavobacteriales bacterium]